MHTGRHSLGTVPLALAALLWVVAEAHALPFVFTSPAGGEGWQAGTVHTVTWSWDPSQCASPSSVGTLALQDPPNASIVVGRDIPLANGSFVWTVPNRPRVDTRLEMGFWCMIEPGSVPSQPFTILPGTVVEADLAVAITVDRATARWGETLAYTATVTNNGPAPAPGVSISAPLPPGLENGTWQCVAQGGAVCTSAGQGGIADVVTLPVGGQVTYTLRARVRFDTVAVIYTGAKATAPPGISDINIDNNSRATATAVIDVRIVSPNGGEVWPLGSVQQISWVSSLSWYVVELSFTDGTTTVPIANMLTPGPYRWTVAGPLTTGRIRARVLNGGQELARDESDGDITITAPVAPPAPRSDFNGDGHPDLFWWHRTAGHLAVWDLDGVTRVDGAMLVPAQEPDVNWQVVGVADFNGDGHPDLLWWHRTAGYLCVWYLDGVTRIGAAMLTPDQVSDVNWQVVGVADFNGDGHPDLLWQHKTGGYLCLWYLDGVTQIGAAMLTPAQEPEVNWQVVGVADFNRDGHPDLLWQHRLSGAVGVWHMDGVQRIWGADVVTATDPTWQVVGVADFNRDGKPDLLWQHQTAGYLAVWYLDGVTRVDGAMLVPDQVDDLNWRVVLH